MVSEDLIIGMELNFLKTKRKKERIKKKRKEKREEKGEKEGTKRQRPRREKCYQSGPEATFLQNPLLLCMNAYAGKEQKSKYTMGRERHAIYNTSLSSSNLASHIRKNSISTNPFCSVKQKNPLSLV